MKNKKQNNTKEIQNFKELIERYKTFGENIAFKYKKERKRKTSNI